MTRAHALRTFRKAGMPLTSPNRDNRRLSYNERLFYVRYIFDSGEIIVWIRNRSGMTFQSPTDAIAYIRRILAVQVVGGNDWALRTGPRGELRLVGGAA